MAGATYIANPMNKLTSELMVADDVESTGSTPLMRMESGPRAQAAALSQVELLEVKNKGRKSTLKPECVENEARLVGIDSGDDLFCILDAAMDTEMLRSSMLRSSKAVRAFAHT